jgi:hypothetical protein
MSVGTSKTIRHHIESCINIFEVGARMMKKQAVCLQIFRNKTPKNITTFELEGGEGGFYRTCKRVEPQKQGSVEPGRVFWFGALYRVPLQCKGVLERSRVLVRRQLIIIAFPGHEGCLMPG